MDITPAKKSVFSELSEILKLSLPIIITMTSQTVMQVVDALMLGNHSASELAAIGPAGLTYWTIGACVVGLMSCNSTFVAQSVGRGDPHGGARYTIHAFLLALCVQAIAVPLAAHARTIFQLYQHGAEIQALEAAYFRPVILRLGGMGLVVALASFFQATGRSRIPMYTGIAANVANFVGDYLLIFGKGGFPEWGIFGAGFMTMLATYLEAAMLLVIFLSARNHREYGTRAWAPFEWRKVVQFLRIGIGSAVTNGLDLASWTIFISIVVGRLGQNVLAGNNAAGQLMHFSFMPAFGLGIGVTALVGRHIGMGDIPGAKRRAYVSMVLAGVYMTVAGIIFVVFRESLIGLFLSGATASADQRETLQAGGTILIYVALFQFADGIGILSAGALKGAGDTRFAALAQIVLAWFVFLPAVFYLGRPEVLGIHGAWLAATGYIWIYDAVLFWRFRSERWKKIDIFA